MTQEFREMLVLFGNACIEKKTELNILSRCDNILEKAKEQGVYYLVFASLKLLHNAGKIHIKDFDRLNDGVMVSCNRNAFKIACFYNVAQELKKHGIRYALLKGDTLASLYRFPAMRISGDIDILIDEENETDVLRILSEFGFSYVPRSKGSNHTECRHPIMGLVEVHVSLYYDFMTDMWFDSHNVQEEYRKVKLTDENEYFTLSINDGYMYIVLHAVKHFLANGLTLKQIMDIALYTSAYKEQIDFDAANSFFEKLKYKRFIDCLYYIAQKYWNINIFDIDDSFEKSAELLLSDCENSGAFGKKKRMGNFYEIYNEMKIRNKGDVDFTEFMTKWRRSNLKDYLSLSKKSMQNKYPSFDISKARVVHLKNILFKCMRYSKKIPQFVKYKPIANDIEAEDRIYLIKELDMI